MQDWLVRPCGTRGGAIQNTAVTLGCKNDRPQNCWLGGIGVAGEETGGIADTRGGPGGISRRGIAGSRHHKKGSGNQFVGARKPYTENHSFRGWVLHNKKRGGDTTTKEHRKMKKNIDPATEEICGTAGERHKGKGRGIDQKKDAPRQRPNPIRDGRTLRTAGVRKSVRGHWGACGGQGGLTSNLLRIKSERPTQRKMARTVHG